MNKNQTTTCSHILSKHHQIEYFAKGLPPLDWGDGLKLFLEHSVLSCKMTQRLFSGSVNDHGSVCRVNIKLNDQYSFIQWSECNCPQYQRTRKICPHITAVIIAGINNNKLVFSTSLLPISQDSAISEQWLKTFEILDLRITSIKFSSKNGFLIKMFQDDRQEEYTQHFNLDEARRFAEKFPQNTCSGSTFMKFILNDQKAFFGCFLLDIPNQSQEIMQGVALRVEDVKFPRKSLPEICEKELVFWPFKSQESVSGRWYIFPFEQFSGNITSQTFFIPEYGFFHLDQALQNARDASASLETAPINNKQLLKHIKNKFIYFRKISHFWLSPHLSKSCVYELESLEKIHIFSQKDGRFSLDLTYKKNNEQFSVLELLKLRSKSNRPIFHDSSKTWIQLPKIIDHEYWEFDPVTEELTTTALGLFRLRSKQGNFDQFVGSRKILDMLQEQLNPRNIQNLPDIQKTRMQLRCYQQEGYRWLWWLYQNKLHGLLADEMGLGKTHQTMALMAGIASTKDTSHHLIVCPTSVIDHWVDKVEEFLSHFCIIRYYGQNRIRNFSSEGKHFAVVTSYGILSRDIKHLETYAWNLFVLDEAHYIKNHKTLAYKQACHLNSDMRLCLSGTPVENHLGELKNLFDFLLPGYLGSQNYFRKHFQIPIEQADNQNREEELQKLLHPFKLRRTKVEVLPELPEKVEDCRHCQLSHEQKTLYDETLKLKADPLVQIIQDDQNPLPSYIHIFAVLNFLKQICNHPALIIPNCDYREHKSGKFDLLTELLDEALQEKQKVVVYSQYVEMIRIIEEHCRERNYGSVTLTGSTRNRGEIINRFQTSKDHRVFLGSLRAGGIGIDLTAASIVIHYDRWWNASKENQATDRVHRIGQTKNVQVLKLITRNTLEDKIDLMIQRKQKLITQFIDKNKDIFKKLSREEILDLLT